MKKIIIIISLIVSNLSVLGQYVPLPTRDLYDTDMMLATISAARHISERRTVLRPIIAEHENAGYKYIREANYSAAISVVNDFFNKYDLYSSELPLVANLFYIKGYSWMKLGSKDQGLSLLRKAHENGNSTATDLLNAYYKQELYAAKDDCYNQNYYSAKSHLNNAYGSGFISAEWYYVYGIIYEDTFDFVNAEKYFKIAKKDGYFDAIQAIKRLKEKKKQMKKQRINK